jgi:hypothetical protein
MRKREKFRLFSGGHRIPRAIQPPGDLIQSIQMLLAFRLGVRVGAEGTSALMLGPRMDGGYLGMRDLLAVALHHHHHHHHHHPLKIRHRPWISTPAFTLVTARDVLLICRGMALSVD